MTNPIPKCGLWVTPATLDELHNQVRQLAEASSDGPTVWTAVMLTLNACHKAVEDQHETV